jgi:hypothetical protein
MIHGQQNTKEMKRVTGNTNFVLSCGLIRFVLRTSNKTNEFMTYDIHIAVRFKFILVCDAVAFGE